VKMSLAERCFPCSALGRHWASRYRQRWSRWRPKHRRPPRPLQTPRRPPPAPLRPPQHAGGIGGHRDAPLAISDGARATVTLLHPQQQLRLPHRNSDPRWANHGLAQAKRAARSRPLACDLRFYAAAGRRIRVRPFNRIRRRAGMSTCPTCERSSPRQRSNPSPGNHCLLLRRAGKLQRTHHRQNRK
jgi:hypothetical protein